MRQVTLASHGSLERYGQKTRREKFLEMHRIMSLAELLRSIRVSESTSKQTVNDIETSGVERSSLRCTISPLVIQFEMPLADDHVINETTE